MLDLTLSIVLTLLAVVAFFFNIYIVVALILAKQVTRPSGNVFLLHLGILNTTFSLVFLSFGSPSLITGEFIGNAVFCSLQGYLFTLLLPAVVWTIACIHLDRFVSVAHPLRYASVMSLRKVAILLGMIWAVCVPLSVSPLFSQPPLAFDPATGLCIPSFVHNQIYLMCFFTLGMLVPICAVLLLNLKIVSIAKYHQFRIANALLGMAFTADHHLSEGAKARERQKDALRSFQGSHAVWTLGQLVGSLVAFYAPFAIVSFFEGWSGGKVHPLAARGYFVPVLVSPIWCSFYFGFKNKALQLTLLNFARKELMKSEVQQEIRLRSPGGTGLFGGPGQFAGSQYGNGRPSMASIIGHITLQMPTYIKRQISMSSLGPDVTNGHETLRPCFSTPTVQMLQKRRKSLVGNDTDSDSITTPKASRKEKHKVKDKVKKQGIRLKRHDSDLTWKINYEKEEQFQHRRPLTSAPSSSSSSSSSPSSTPLAASRRVVFHDHHLRHPLHDSPVSWKMQTLNEIPSQERTMSVVTSRHESITNLEAKAARKTSDGHHQEPLQPVIVVLAEGHAKRSFIIGSQASLEGSHTCDAQKGRTQHDQDSNRGRRASSTSLVTQLEDFRVLGMQAGLSARGKGSSPCLRPEMNGNCSVTNLQCMAKTPIVKSCLNIMPAKTRMAVARTCAPQSPRPKITITRVPTIDQLGTNSAPPLIVHHVPRSKLRKCHKATQITTASEVATDVSKERTANSNDVVVQVHTGNGGDANKVWGAKSTRPRSFVPASVCLKLK